MVISMDTTGNGIDHVLLVGSPGTGRTTWARRQSEGAAGWLHLAMMDTSERLERLRRATGVGRPCSGLNHAPFRAPHHTALASAMTGRLLHGWDVQPGELSLAHGGVLFLDDVTDFRGDALDAVRFALQTGHVGLNSDCSGCHVRLPAQFRLVAAMNPCPCGWRGSGTRKCSCSPDLVTRHEARVPQWLRSVCRTITAATYQKQAANYRGQDR